MSTLSLRLPDSLHKKVRELAKKDGISINQFITTATAEKLAALMKVEYLEARGQRGNRTGYEQVLQKVKDQPAVAEDELPDP